MGFLEEILRETRRTVDAPGYGQGLPELPSRRTTSFRAAVERDRASGALVVEYKRVSPGQSEPKLPTRSIPEFLRLTETARPTAFSCLATTPRFDGSPSDVAELAGSTSRPVLFKDFVVDARQVRAAARAGASAILLIARLSGLLEGTAPLVDLANAAHAEGLEVLLELHARSELSRVANVVADVYGVNVRNLDTLAIDRPTAAETLREARSAGLRPLLGLSGVADATDAGRFWADGVDGILVGSAVARAADPAHFLETLRRGPPGGTP